VEVKQRHTVGDEGLLRSREAHMADLEARRETGTSLMFLGCMVWVADLLVLFFLPAGFKQGRQELFLGIMIILFLLGTYLTVTGYLMRTSAGNEE
jgi:hypothetical protein